MKYAKKIDKSQPGIVTALEQIGCLVWKTKGEIDLVVQDPQSGNRQGLMDCKTHRTDGGKDALTPAQETMLADGWAVDFPYSAEDAINIVAAWRRAWRKSS